MSHYIIYKDGAYNIYSTMVDSPLYVGGLTFKQLEKIVRQEEGERGMYSFQERLKRAHESGCSAIPGMTLEELIVDNRAGIDDCYLPFDEFVARYLTLPIMPITTVEELPEQPEQPKCRLICNPCGQDMNSPSFKKCLIFDASPP